MLLVHSKELVPLLFFRPHGTIANTGLYRRRQLQGSAHPEVLSSPQVWASPWLNVPHLPGGARSTSSISAEVASTDSVPCVVESVVPFEPELRRLLAVRDCTHQTSSIHCSLWSDNPADPLSSQPYDLQPHRAAIHPHSFLHRRRWEWCYQELAYGQRMHRRQRDLVQGHAVCVSELNPLNTRPFYLILTSNVYEYIFPLWFKLVCWFPTLKQFPAFPWHEFWTHPLKAYGLFLASKWIYKLGKACEPEFESQPNNLFWL